MHARAALRRMPRQQNTAHTPSHLVTAAKTGALALVKMIEEDAKDKQACCICWDKMIDTRLDPCGHSYLYLFCATRLLRCPLCRRDIIRLRKGNAT